MTTSQVDFANPLLITLYTDVLDYLRNNINAVGQMDYTGAINIPVGVIQWNETSKIFEKWGGSSWGEIYTTFPSGFTMLAVQNSAPTGWTRKTLSCSDNAMFCYAASGNTNYGGSVNPQSTHDHNIAGHTHDTTNHSPSIAVHSHTLNSHTHTMNDHIHGLGSHIHSGTGLYAAISRAGGGTALVGRDISSPVWTSNWVSTPIGIGSFSGSISYGSAVVGNTGAAVGNTAIPSTENTSTPSTSNTGSGGTTATGSAGSDTTSGSSESTTGSNSAPYYQEVIAIEKN